MHQPHLAILHRQLPLVVQVNYLPISVIVTAFKKENVRRPLEGFGVLVPSKEQQNGLKTLGKPFYNLAGETMSRYQ